MPVRVLRGGTTYYALHATRKAKLYWIKEVNIVRWAQLELLRDMCLKRTVDIASLIKNIHNERTRIWYYKMRSNIYVLQCLSYGHYGRKIYMPKYRFEATQRLDLLAGHVPKRHG